MPSQVTVRDETMSGSAVRSFSLEFPTERITVRELIRERVYQDVQDYNRRKDGTFNGLVRPTASEAVSGMHKGFKVRAGAEIDWKAQFEKACEAYAKNRILVLVGDRQTDSLEQVVELTRGVEVAFLRLVMLVGG